MLGLAHSDLREPTSRYGSDDTDLQACFAGALFGVDAGIIGGVLAMPDFKRYVSLRDPGKQQLTGPFNNREFGLDKLSEDDNRAADLSGNLVTTMQAGAILGALVSSTYADRKGRKPALLGVAITGFVGGILQAFSYGHLPAFYIGR